MDKAPRICVRRSHQIILRCIIAFVLLGATSACVGGGKKNRLRPDGIPGSNEISEDAAHQEAKEFEEIEALFSKSLNASAQSKMTAFLKKHPRSTLVPSVENLFGLLLLRTKKPLQAIPHFKKAIEGSSSKPNFSQYVYFNLATAEFEANRPENALEVIQQIKPDDLDKTNKIKVYHLKANIYSKKSLFLEASQQLLAGGRLLSDPESLEMRKLFGQRLDQELDKIKDQSSLQTLLRDYEDSAIADVLLFRLGSLEMSMGNSLDGEIHLRNLLNHYPKSTYFSQATDLLSKTPSSPAIRGRSIGVLLPLKGKFGKFGMKSLQGIQMAFGIFNSNEPDLKVTLVIEDSGETTEQAINALNRLALKHQVIAVIGPMLSKGIDVISQRAQDLGVPLISLARRSGSNLDFVFQAGLTQQIQAQQIAKYAFEKLGARRFAILFPNEKIGQEASLSFWDAIESLGGKIVGYESYNPAETDFRQTVDKLSGLYYTEARQRELDLLAQEREANKIKKRTRKTEQYFHLTPIVDYDAVFIPDEPKVASQIMPTFAYRDVEHVKFLGTSAWNSPDLLNRAQNYAEHASFVDAYFADSSSSLVHKFAEKYKTTYGQEATSLEALAYDAGLVIRNILSSSNRDLTRFEIRDRLKATHEFQGVTGKITYKDGQFFRDLTVLRVKSGQFIEAKK